MSTHFCKTPLALALLAALSLPTHAAMPGDRAGPTFKVNTQPTSQGTPAVAMDADGDFVIAWTPYRDNGSIHAQRYAANGTPLGSEFQVNTTMTYLYATYYQEPIDIAMDADGDFVIVWVSAGQDGSGRGIYAQRYAANGAPQGTEFQVNTYTTEDQVAPTIAMSADGDFVIAWGSNEYGGNRDGIFAQRYAADGSPLGTEFQVNTTMSPYQFYYSSIAMDADGDFLITWDEPFGIFAQRYASDGTPLGTSFKVNTDPARNGSYPRVAMDTDGDFVITWASSEINGIRGIHAQRYTSNGTPLGTEFQVNTSNSGAILHPAIDMDADGGFVITWQSARESSGYDIYAQRYAADGTPLGSEFIVNPEQLIFQFNPTIALDADGDFVVAWDYGGSGVFAQRYVGNQAVDIYLNNTDTPDPVGMDAPLQYTLSVSNTHPVSNLTGVPAIDSAIGSAHGISLSDTLPAGVIFDSGVGTDWTCGESAGVVNCTFAGTLPAGGTTTVTIDVTTPSTAGMLINTASVTATQFDPNAVNNTENEDTTVQTVAQTMCHGMPVTILGTAGDDVIEGTEGPDVIHGLEGNDTIRGHGGDDLICGGTGNDLIRGGAGNDRIRGGAGSDRIFGDGGDDILRGNAGNDELHGGGGRDKLFGGNGNDTLDGGNGIDEGDGGNGGNVCNNLETQTNC